MNIWVDADACPGVIKEVLYRAAERTQTQVTFVSNHYLRLPPSKYLTHLQVEKGFDVADNEIAKRAQAGDLIVTSDIPLAAEVIEAGCFALNPRGELYEANSIKAKLTMRDFMDTLRASGVNTGGPPAMSQAERQRFANHLDRLLQQQRR